MKKQIDQNMEDNLHLNQKHSNLCKSLNDFKEEINHKNQEIEELILQIQNLSNSFSARISDLKEKLSQEKDVVSKLSSENDQFLKLKQDKTYQIELISKEKLVFEQQLQNLKNELEDKSKKSKKRSYFYYN
jgi:uncharacterized phage infection (PIP) family protein YhgE